MINDLTAQGLLYKFLDDVTLSETVVQGTPSCFNSSIEEIIVWSKLNHMNINWNKTKEMILGSVKDLIAQPLRVEEHVIQRVDSFKLLGLIIDSNLRWNKHVEFICSKASQRLHYLKLLKRSGLSSDELLYFYCTVIRTVLEYACPAWHTNLTLEETNSLEDVQKRALSIIFGLGDYDDQCERAQLTTLDIRREDLCMRFFFRKVLNPGDCLNYLLPEPNLDEHTYQLRQRHRYAIPFARTERFRNSFILYALRNFI